MKAATSIHHRDEKIQEAAELIEMNLVVLGATGIEDKLQVGVPNTIEMLKKAGIKVWVLTGDKIETAVNIGYSCKLLGEKTNLVYLVDERQEELKDTVRRTLRLNGDRKKENHIALIIDGKVNLN